MTPKRCPVCLTRHLLDATLKGNTQVKCAKCGNTSKMEFWLDARELPAGSAAAPPAEKATATDKFMVAMLGVLLIIAAWSASYFYMKLLKGPDFLLFFFLVLIVLWILSAIARHAIEDTWTFSIIGCVVFEGVGVIRLVSGWLAGMHNFGFMIAMMFFGAFIFFVRAKAGGGYGVGGSCAGGGCGGSGCGGGGCGGGCGGCGG
jgi:hypothetical protein